MTEAEAYAREILRRWEQELLPFLQEQSVQTTDAVERLADRVRTALARDPRVDVGFLGESQVGKSTLINALVDRKVLPSGGIGPLTAQATRIVHAPEQRMYVRYHGRQRMNQFAFALRAYLDRRGELPASAAADADDRAPDEDAEHTAGMVLGEADGENGAAGKSALGEAMFAQVGLMVTGKEQHALPRVVLLDAARAVLGSAPLGEPGPLEPFSARIQEIRAMLGTERSFAEAEVGGRVEFNKQLKLNAAGWCAPLVNRLEVEIDNAALEQLVLVDLPGVGVVGDPAGKVAEEFVTQSADALVLVTTNKGLTESLATTLERSNVITKLLFGGNGGVPPVHVVIAVTHLDDVVKDRFMEARGEAEAAGEEPPDRHGMFERASLEMSEQIRRQLTHALLHSKAFEELGDDVRERRTEIVTGLCERMDVVCVDAPSYLQLRANYAEEAFLKRLDATNVLRFREVLVGLRDAAVRRREQGMRETAAEMVRAMRQQLDALRSLYAARGDATPEEWVRYRAALQDALAPLREDMQRSHGELLATLKDGVPRSIATLCHEAARVGHKRLQRLRAQGEKLNYMVLNAALTRNGVYSRRGVDYPDELARALVETVAVHWEPTVIQEVRQGIKKMARRDAKLIERLCARATENGVPGGGAEQAQLQRTILLQGADSAVEWTNDRLQELQAGVHQELKAVVERPIERACVRARNEGDNRHAGAKQRILDAFDKAGGEAIDVAREQAEKVLRKHYALLLARLEAGYLRAQSDPLRVAFEALAGEALEHARRADDARRAELVGRIDAFRSLVAGEA